MRRVTRQSNSGGAVIILVLVMALVIILLTTAFYREALRGQNIAVSASISSEVQARNDLVGRWLMAAIPRYIQTQMQQPGGIGNNDRNGFISTGQGSALLATMPPYSAAQTMTTLGFGTDHIPGDAGQLGAPQAVMVGSANQSAPANYNILVRSLANYTTGDLIPVPQALFALRPPGGTFVARQYEYTANTTFSIGADSFFTGTRAAANPLRNRRITLYEVPMQSAITADAMLQLNSSPGVNLAGGVVATEVNLTGGNVEGNLAATRRVNVNPGATVRGAPVNLPSNYGTEVYAPGGILADRRISTSGDAGRTLFLRINRGLQYYSSVASPTNWDLYTLPFYRCSVRIVVNSSTATATSVTISVHNPSTVDGMTSAIVSRTAQSNQATWNTQGFSNFLSIEQTTANPSDPRRILRIDPVAMATTVSGWPGVAASFGGTLASQRAALNKVYVGLSPNSLPTPDTVGDLGVTLGNANDLSIFTNGFSLVTRHRFYFTGPFNTTGLAASIIAPQLRFGADAAPQPVTIEGRMGFVGASGTVQPHQLRHGSGSTVSTRTLNLSDAMTVSQIPPIVPVDWFLVLEEL